MEGISCRLLPFEAASGAANMAADQALLESAAQGVSRSEFEMFANRLLRDQAAILSVSWIPRIKHDERAEHEVVLAPDVGARHQHLRDVAARHRGVFQHHRVIQGSERGQSGAPGGPKLPSCTPPIKNSKLANPSS